MEIIIKNIVMKIIIENIDGLVQDCSNSIANALALPVLDYAINI